MHNIHLTSCCQECYCSQLCSVAVCISLMPTCSLHTHIHICIYIYIYILLSSSLDRQIDNWPETECWFNLRRTSWVKNYPYLYLTVHRRCLSLPRPRGSYRTYTSQEAKTCLSLSRRCGSNRAHTSYIVKVTRSIPVFSIHQSYVFIHPSFFLGEDSILRV